jgi:pilus assembly protein TadC
LGAGAGVVLAEWWGAVAGGAAGLACGWWLARQPSAAERAIRRQFEADLPFAIDLVAAALRAGSPADAALRVVADAVGGPVATGFERIVHALRLGTPVAEAWTGLGDGDGAVRVARAASHSSHSGAALSRALFRIADDLRGDMALATEAAARRAGVLVVLPLGLCFLPAFVLTGVVPVVVAVIGGVLGTAP